MSCPKCNISVFDRPFMRINKTGIDGIWWCEDCVKKHEPELYNNLKEDETPVEEVLKEICYGK